MVLPLSGVPPDPCHKSGNTIIPPRRDFYRFPPCFPAHASSLAIGANRSEQDCQRSQTTKNDRILSNFTKNRRQSSPEGTAEEMPHSHVHCLVHDLAIAPKQPKTIEFYRTLPKNRRRSSPAQTASLGNEFDEGSVRQFPTQYVYHPVFYQSAKHDRLLRR
jgi:hypothetical protein